MTSLKLVFAVLLFISLSRVVFANDSGSLPQSDINPSANAGSSIYDALSAKESKPETPTPQGQSIVLSYSTYLQTDRSNESTLETAISSVDSSGSACVTNGDTLWVYNSAGVPTVQVTSLVASFGILPSIVFRDQSGNCFVGGFSAGGSPNPGDTIFNQPVFGVVKISPTGTKVFATFFGGGSSANCNCDSITGITVDPSENVYIVGSTGRPDFPTHNALQNLLGSPSSSFIVKLDPTGANLVYSTFFGDQTNTTGVATDTSGETFIVGNGGTITTTPGAFQAVAQFPGNAPFVAKLDVLGSLIYATYLGGTGTDSENAIAVDSTGNAYVAGRSGSSDFPTAINTFQTTPKGDVVSKLSSDGTSLVYSAFLGDSSSATGLGQIVVDSNGNAYVAGTGTSGFPLLNPVQSDLPIQTITGINNTGTALLFSTFFGGDTAQTSQGTIPTKIVSLGIDASENVYFSGTTSVKAFPLLAASNGLLDESLVCFSGNPCLSRGFVAKISSGSSTVLSSPSGVNFSFGQASTVPLANVGTTDIQINDITVNGDFSITSNPCVGVLASALHCEMIVTFAPTGGGTRTGTLTVTSDAPDSPRIIQLTGIGQVPAVSLSPSSLSLTSPSIGTTGSAQSVTLSNTGTDTLNIGGLSIVGTSAADFSETHNCSAQVAASGSCQINISYKASASNSESATLQITDDAAGSPHAVNLTGTILAVGPPVVSLSTNSLTLTSPTVGTSGSAQSITLSNTGMDTLNISGVAIVGASAADFSETHNCSTQIAASGSCQINISYKASTSNSESATLQITDNAIGSPHAVNLTGTISALGLGVTSGMPSSQTINAGQTANYNLAVGGPGFSGSVSLSCTRAPAATTCTVPNSVNLGATPTSFQASVTTTARPSTSGALKYGNTGNRIMLPLFGFCLLGFTLIGTNWKHRCSAVLFTCMLVIAITSCGGGSNSTGSTGTGGGSGGSTATGTPSGSYTLVVTANNNAGLTQSINLTLNVN